MDQIPLSVDLCLISAGTPPNSTITNFENPETLVPVMISMYVIMLVVAVFFTTCRLFANRRKLWWSDYKEPLGLVYQYLENESEFHN